MKTSFSSSQRAVSRRMLVTALSVTRQFFSTFIPPLSASLTLAICILAIRSSLDRESPLWERRRASANSFGLALGLLCGGVMVFFWRLMAGSAFGIILFHMKSSTAPARAGFFTLPMARRSLPSLRPLMVTGRAGKRIRQGHGPSPVGSVSMCMSIQRK